MVRLGFACAWDPEPMATWSYTPWNLRSALSKRVHVVDVGFEVAPIARKAIKLLHARRDGKHVVSSYKHSRIWSAVASQTLRAGVARSSVDAVLQIQDLSLLDVPYFLYQDASYDLLLELIDQQGHDHLPHFGMLRERDIRVRRERQLAVYQQAAGLFAMSRWFADGLVRLSGVPREKVHVVHAGVNSPSTHHPRFRDRPRRKLLFLGRDFHTKAGDLVVDAMRRLRRDFDPLITLTVAGPELWPLVGPPPDGVEYLGRVSTEAAAELIDSHDLLVMPSRFEAFGIVFAEALSAGMPCVARNAFAMPELVVKHFNGELLDGDDAADLAILIARTLEDDAIYANAFRDAVRQRQYFAWDRAATQMVHVINGHVVGNRQMLQGSFV